MSDKSELPSNSQQMMEADDEDEEIRNLLLGKVRIQDIANFEEKLRKRNARKDEELRKRLEEERKAREEHRKRIQSVVWNILTQASNEV